MRLATYDVDLFLTRKRERKAKKKRIRIDRAIIAAAHASDFHRRRAVVFGASSRIAKMLSDCAVRDVAMPQTSLYLKVPDDFSMQTSPGEVIDFISSFARTHVTRSISDVYVDFSPMKSQDLGAHALLDLLVEEMKLQAAFQNTRIRWRGRFPTGLQEKRFIRSMGIIRVLDIRHHFLPIRDASAIIRFERRCRHYMRELKAPNPSNKTQQANAAQRFAEHVNRCLAKEGHELTPTARARLCDFVVEIIDNAENHAGMVDWTIQGYIDMASEQPHCEIVIFNFGKSIAETLGAVAPDSYTWNQISKYLEIHSKAGWLSPKWRREDLLTLIALQGSVSSLNDSIDATRGQGTADLIEFFQGMHDERLLDGSKPAHMYIVSGSTKVVIDGRYRMERDASSHRTIAFNKENDLRKPPDPTSVMPLKGPPLPGTIIGIKFLVHSESLQTAVES